MRHLVDKVIPSDAYLLNHANTIMTIVITLPYFFDGEAEQIVQLLHSSVDLVHLRKPSSKAEEMERLILSIPNEYYPRLVLHDHHELAVKYHLHGVHLNSRNPLPPSGWTGSVSRSCHSLEELKTWKGKCNYVSLSPIFDSISKKGYHAAFSSEEIEQARKCGIIDSKVMALGGITFDKMDDVLRMGFGGGMILGDAWKNVRQPQEPVALTIAGSDSSAGAGIQQDLKTMTTIGVYGATVITAITSQNTLGVKSVMPVPAEVVESQLEAVLSDLNVKAIKIGMVPNAQVAHVIATTLEKYKAKHTCDIVYDPVMISTSGHPLMEEDCIGVVCEELMTLCTLITPNIPEKERLSQLLSCQNSKISCLVKGGHAKGDELADVLYLPNGDTYRYPTERIATHNLHGTGCTLSSAIAAYLVKGHPLPSAIEKAKEILAKGIRNGARAHIGKGNGPLLMLR